MPRASKEGVNGIVTRLLHDSMHAKIVPDDPELTLRPDMKKTLRNSKTMSRFHNGTYEQNKFEMDQTEEGEYNTAWSCC